LPGPWSRFSEEFHCRGCGALEAFRSRPRGFFEKFVLPIFFLQPVRCERCYQRVYVCRTIPVLERDPNDHKHPQNDQVKGPKSSGRVA
jgi:hypothetical protein